MTEQYSADEHIKAELAEIAAQDLETQAFLFPEIQISRQYSAHVLHLPGQNAPTWHRWFFQAMQAAHDAGYDSLTLCIDDAQYSLRLNQGD